MSTNPVLAVRHRAVNRLHTVLIVAAMLGIAGLLGWAIAGGTGLLWGGAVGAAGMMFAGRISPRLVLAMYGGRPLSPPEAPGLHATVAELARHAGLPAPPRLYYVPSQVMNAFAVGEPRDAAIGVTDGLLRGLTARELAAVLAHEISHIRAGDLRVMALADVSARITSLFSTLGQLALFMNLPLLLLQRRGVPWLLVFALIFAPAITVLLQLALSRTREWDADVEAALLTGDPGALASALAKMERAQGGMLEQVFLPGRRIPDPSLLRTHPATAERIRRLHELDIGPEHSPIPVRADAVSWIDGRPAVTRRPRRHVSGLWY